MRKTAKKRAAKRSTWTAAQNTRACQEQGWAIFERGNAPGAPDYSADTIPHICRDDETGAFAYDVDAWRFVWQTALGADGTGKEGNKLAQAALAHLKKENPVHYLEIMHVGEQSTGQELRDCEKDPCDLCKKRAAATLLGRCYDCDQSWPHEPGGKGCKVKAEEDDDG